MLHLMNFGTSQRAHDVIGLKITDSFRKGIKDLEDVTEFDPTEENLIIERFGLNMQEIINYNLMWIDNARAQMSLL